MGAKVINLSWGTDLNPTGIPSPGSMDLFYDEFVRFRNVTVVKSAGNEGSDCGRNGNITSPGMAYNIITAGAFKDLNTTGWADDKMFDCSSWRGPASSNGDREKPELVAPGFKIFTTSLVSTWFANQDGTSMAAPHVTATAALMIQRDPNLADKPNLIKAILLASAAHNIEDGPVFGYRDGAGAISASWAYDITRRWMGGWGFITYNCTFPNPYLGVTLINLQANVRTRVAIVWSQEPSFFDYYNRPSADVDLQVVAPAPHTNAYWSSSFDNTYEIVDFNPPVTGNYSLYLWRRNCSINPGSVAYAVWQEH